ncbi:AAA family ATPase [Niabella sp. 22666]|uniref:AAA family ATPase n=1 Tax=Niabella sp. 22666 TaxID=3453954 RepID=UPI003F850C6C
MSKTFTYAGWRNMPTIQSKEIITELIDAKENCQARLLISETGLGKSHSVQLFNVTRPNHTYIITVGDSWKPVDLVDAMMTALGINQYMKHRERQLNRKIQKVAEKVKQLKASGAEPVFVIDEAENLRPAFLKMIKEIYDAIIKYCSLVLIGTPFIMESLLNTRSKNRMGAPQTYRRFKAGIRYISPINKARDFTPFFNEYLSGCNDVQDLLLENADNYGELHDFLEPLLRRCKKNGEQPSAKLFKMIHKIK